MGRCIYMEFVSPGIQEKRRTGVQFVCQFAAHPTLLQRDSEKEKAWEWCPNTWTTWPIAPSHKLMLDHTTPRFVQHLLKRSCPGSDSNPRHCEFSRRVPSYQGILAGWRLEACNTIQHKAKVYNIYTLCLGVHTYAAYS